MRTSFPLKVQSIRTKGQKQRPYVYLSAELAEKTGLKKKGLVEWELINRRKLCLNRLLRKKSAGELQSYPLKVQAINSKKQKSRLYVYLPVPLAAAIRLRQGEAVWWEHNGTGLFLIRKA